MDILTEARQIIDGARQDTYGDPREMWRRIAAAWSIVFGVEVTPEQAVLAMVMLKAARETVNHNRDNLVDLAAYAEILSRMTDTDEENKYLFNG